MNCPVASIISHSAGETAAFGRRLAAECRRGSVIALVGDLGVGKTQLVKGIAAELGVEAEVTSPTFTLIHEYRGGRLPLFHFDHYRLESAAEALALGLDDYLESDGVCVLEWADKFPELLPARTRRVTITIRDDGSREIVTTANED